MCKSCDWQAKVEEADEVLESLDDLPDRATEFREGVEERLKGMMKWMNENRHVTDKMVAALDNIKSGVAKWLDG